MKKAVASFFVSALLLLLPAAQAVETGDLLSQEDLRNLQPAYEAFLEELADTIIAKGLLREEERETWMMVQLGDFVQNGGSGSIVSMYTMDLLELARPQETMIRLTKDFSFGTLTVETMRGYNPSDASLPGLLLSADVTQATGEPVECRFRWTSNQGGFLAWDAFTATTSDVGNTLINDGRPAYWSDQPLLSGQQGLWILTIEVLSMEDDLQVLDEAMLTLTPDGEGWLVLDNALQ